jgi:hypothetical protein
VFQPSAVLNSAAAEEEEEEAAPYAATIPALRTIYVRVVARCPTAERN